MGRIMDITIEGKPYQIEYNRETVVRLMEAMKDAKNDNVSMAINFIHYGLLLHHSKDMPTRDELVACLIAFEDTEAFVKALSDLVQEVVSAIEQDKKQGNFKWGLRTK